MRLDSLFLSKPDKARWKPTGTAFTLLIYLNLINLNLLHTLSLCYVPVAFDMFGE